MDALEKRKFLLPLPGFELQFPCRPDYTVQARNPIHNKQWHSSS